MGPYELLLRSIDFANEELENFKADNDLQDHLCLVLSSLFRKIIELSDGVRVCAENGLRGPADINYRGLLEAYLAFEFIIQEPELANNRAYAYKIGFHKQQIKAAKYALRNSHLSHDEKTIFENAIKYHTTEIEKEELSEVLKEYNRLQNMDRFKSIPKWYSLYDGPNSINKLAKILEKNSSDPNLVSKIYSFLSIGAHNYIDLRDAYTDDNGKVSLKRTRYLFNPNVDHYNLIPTRSLLISSIKNFTNILYPEYINHFRDFGNEISCWLN